MRHLGNRAVAPDPNPNPHPNPHPHPNPDPDPHPNLNPDQVRHLGNRLHTIVWTLATAISTLMFTSPSTGVAMASVPFGCAEDTMQAAATARLVQAGAAQGMRKGQLAADYGNLVAVVRVFGLYFFGKLCSVGMSTGMPQLPYVICAALQLVAVALVFTLPTASWRNDPEGDADADADSAAAGD